MRCATRFVAALAAVAVVGYASFSSAASFPATLVPNAALTTAQVSVSLNGFPLGSAPIVPNGGSIALSVDQTGSAPPAISLDNLNGQISVNNLTIAFLSVTGVGLQVGNGTGSFPTNGVNPGTVDLGGLFVSINQGLVNGGLFDFSASPANFNLPSPTIANFSEVLSGPNTYDLTLTIPVNVSGSSPVQGIGTVGFSLVGNLAFTGTKVVPEPGTIAMLGMGVIGLVAVGRRRFRKA